MKKIGNFTFLESKSLKKFLYKDRARGVQKADLNLDRSRVLLRRHHQVQVAVRLDLRDQAVAVAVHQVVVDHLDELVHLEVLLEMRINAKQLRMAQQEIVQQVSIAKNKSKQSRRAFSLVD